MSRTAFARRLRAALLGRGLGLRVLATLLAMVQLGSATVVPVADGFAGHEVPAVVHFEDADGGDCPVPHGHADCTLCQLVQGSRAVTPSKPAVEAVLAAIALAAMPEAPQLLRAPAYVASLPSRAPPLG